MTIDMNQFFQAFFDEAEELLAEKERLLLAVDLAAPQKEEIDAIFRAAHSIKGGAATFGLADITEVTHVMESLLDRIRKDEVALTAEHVEVFLDAKDVLTMLLDGHRRDAPVDKMAVEAIRGRLQELQAAAGMAHDAAAGTAGKNFAVAAAAAAPAERRLRVKLPALPDKDISALAAELALMGAVTTERHADGSAAFVIATGDSADDVLAVCSFIVDPDGLRIEELPAEPVPASTTTLDLGIAEEGPGYGLFAPLPLPVARPAAQETEVSGKAKTAAKVAASAESSSIRVGIDKVDQLINLVGELVITQAMIEQRAGILDPILHEKLLAGVGQLRRNTRDLQEAVMSIRMMPMDYVFSRFPRMVRDLAGKLGKKVEFVVHGASTELDKGLIERIIDPLTHLVRNSIDHGIEKPASRLAAGKTEAGSLSLSASHQGGNIVIEVSDDGGGLDRERILAKARQQGMAVDEAMADDEVWQLIFAPGFSTAEAVTDVSGRGVGMDVVRRNIGALGGTIAIRSQRGYGTTMTISLPLTLAILDGMSVGVGSETYILPLAYVVESLQPAAVDVRDVAEHGTVVRVRGEYLPLVALYRQFGIEPRSADPSQGIVVILESEGTKAALLVDELLGQQQVVVKNLETNYRKVAGISGATILGDGGVALILDVAGLLRSTRRQASAILDAEEAEESVVAVL